MLIAATTLGCGSDPEPEPIRLEITAAATEDVNTDAAGSPSLIVARLFVLRGQSAFVAADFFALWDKEQAVLARDLLSREELVLKPGQTTTLKSVVDGDARVLGVAAAYRDIDRATWRAMAPLTEGQVNALKIELARSAVRLQPLFKAELKARGNNNNNKEQ